MLGFVVQVLQSISVFVPLHGHDLYPWAYDSTDTALHIAYYVIRPDIWIEPFSRYLVFVMFIPVVVAVAVCLV
jgi:hypothetical protein